MNFYDWFRYGIGEDSVYYGHKGYDRDSSGRAKLYVLACNVARDAITKADPNAKIYTNAVLLMNLIGRNGRDIPGKNWMRTYYSQGGKGVADVITWHWYNDADSSRHKFEPCRFIVDYDTLRQVMREGGEGDKVVWADEGGYGDTLRNGTSYCTEWSVDRAKQADIAVQVFATGLGQQENPQGPAIGQVNWFKLYNDNPDSQDTCWVQHAGLLGRWNQTTNTFPNKPSSYAFRQMTRKLKSLNFNRRVPRPDTNVYAYEFQIPGPDTTLRTWCLWRTAGTKEETLSLKTNQAFLVTRDTFTTKDSVLIDTDPQGFYGRITDDGKIIIYANRMDIVPRYLHEYGAVGRPDVIVDSLWLVPSDPRAGEGVWFYARLKNIGNATLSGSVWNSVTFQVDGVSKKTYQIQQQLDVGATVTLGGDVTADWTATWGDHLIRAWADSSDKYVELREDNNQGYIFRHFQPKVSVIINNDHKYTNHLTNDTLHVVMNESTSPLPDSAKLLHEGTWTRLGVYGSRDTIVSYSGNEVKYDSVKVFQGGDTYTGGDSIIVDASSPFVDITSPTMGQTVSGNVPFWGWSWDYEDHDSLWEIYVNGSPWVSGNNKVGENPMFGMPGQFGTWDSRTVPNGWWWHQLRSTDAATNLAKDSVKVKVRNFQTNGGDSWVSDFGTYSSPVMNVATDIAGNIYFAETQNSKVRKYSPRKDSLFAFSAKRGNDSTGTNWATALILKDSTKLYVADGYAHCIKAFDIQGNLLLRFGSFGSGQGQFKQPCGIALDHKGRLFVVDRLNHRVQVFSDSSGGFLFQFGSQGADSGRFNSPTGITITPNGLVWVSDTRNNQVQVFDSLGHYLKTIKQVDSLGLDTPLGICSDKWGNVFIADAHHNRIVELNPYGQRILDFGGQGDSLWQFRTPVGLASSPGAHYLYVADMGNRRVQKFIVIEEDTTGGGPQAGAGVQVLPLVYELGPAIPNPTNGATTIRYSLPKESQVNLTIYNVAGQMVREFNQGKQKAGYYSITWDGRSNRGHKVGAGVYFYRLQAGNWAKTRKMVVIR
jgi:hypothetical protein